MATGRMASNAPARGALRQRLAHSRPVSLLHKLTGGDRFRQSHAACQTQVKSPASHHSHLLSPGHLTNHVIRAIPGHRSYLREIWLSPEDFKVLYATRDIACEGKRKVAWGAGGRHRPAQALVQGAGGAETGRPPRVPRGPPGFSLQTRLGPNVRRPARPPPRQCMRPATYPRCLRLLRALGFISLNGKENERVTVSRGRPTDGARARPTRPTDGTRARPTRPRVLHQLPSMWPLLLPQLHRQPARHWPLSPRWKREPLGPTGFISSVNSLFVQQ